jgi:hypothetical protein
MEPFLTLGLILVASGPREVGFERDFVTANEAVFCSSPFQVTEGKIALERNDHQWIDRAGCVALEASILLVRIEPTASDILRHRGPWKVRLMLPSGGNFTAWGDPDDFRFTDGARILR